MNWWCGPTFSEVEQLQECAKVAEQYCNDRAAHPGGCEIAHAIRTAQPAKAQEGA
jgi:hypothetical protein